MLFVPGLPGNEARAQTSAGYVMPAADFTYHLQRFSVAGTNPTQYLWTIKSPQNKAVRFDGTAFRPLASPALRKWITVWQHNSTVPITYVADKDLDAKLDPAASKLLAQELDDFAQFCRSQGEAFIIRPPHNQKPNAHSNKTKQPAHVTHQRPSRSIITSPARSTFSSATSSSTAEWITQATPRREGWCGCSRRTKKLPSQTRRKLYQFNQNKLEVPARIELAHKGFADLSLTTWARHRGETEEKAIKG